MAAYNLICLTLPPSHASPPMPCACTMQLSLLACAWEVEHGREVGGKRREEVTGRKGRGTALAKARYLCWRLCSIHHLVPKQTARRGSARDMVTTRWAVAYTSTSVIWRERR